MVALRELWNAIARTIAEWQSLRLAEMQFAKANMAVLVITVLVAVTVFALFLRSLSSNRPGRRRVTLPAVLPVMRTSYATVSRHLPLVLFLVGIPFFVVALADPYTAFLQEDVSYPGRRIAVMVDASTSMNQPFQSEKLNPTGGATYFATVGAAEYFVKLRMQGPHRDLISLIEFGNEAYVVTPFTTDYENVLLSLKLVSDPQEWDRFPDQGTMIMQAIKQGTELFKTFDFLNASGNLMVIFSDGEDTQVKLEGMSLDDIMSQARKYKIPVYFIRMAYNKSAGSLLPDEIWKKAVERTGGRFYAAANEDSILQAVNEIDRLEPGRIDRREYSAQRPRFAGYTLMAVALWLAATWLQLGVRQFRTFP